MEFGRSGRDSSRTTPQAVCVGVHLERARRNAEFFATQISDVAEAGVVSALADVAEVLTSEQRAVLSERIEQFKSMRGRWHRG